MNALTNSQNRWYDAIFFHLEPVDGFVAGNVQLIAALVSFNVQQCIVFDTVPLLNVFGHAFSLKMHNMPLTCHKYWFALHLIAEEDARNLFLRSKLPLHILSKIW